MEPMYLSIRPVETGKRIKQLLSEQNYTIREIQGAFGFENPQAIYKWISGKSLPSLDNFIILSRLLHTSIEDILVIDGDISFSRIFLNYRFNDIPARLSYNHTIRKRYGKSVRREKLMKNFLKLVSICTSTMKTILQMLCLRRIRFPYDSVMNLNEMVLRTVLLPAGYGRRTSPVLRGPWNHCITRCSCSVIAIMRNSVKNLWE